MTLVPLPYETEGEHLQRDARLQRVIAIHRELDALALPPATKKLLDEWSEIQLAETLAVEDQALRMAGEVCREAGRLDLFERIFELVRDGDQIDAGDAERWLNSTRHPHD